MFRMLCSAALAASLCACATFPAGYVLGQNEGEELTVFKPGTQFAKDSGADEVWIQIPMVWVNGCPDGKMEFTHKDHGKEMRWSLKTQRFGETTVRFSRKALTAIAASARAHTILHSAVDSAKEGCALELGPDAPKVPERFRSDVKTFVRGLLDVLVAERLPTTAASSWVDQFDFDSLTSSINVLPGMRLKIQPELPFTSDSADATNPHLGVVSSPMHLELAATGKDEPGRGRWSVSLDKLEFSRFVGTGGQTDPTRPWFSASGIASVGTDGRFWRLFVPKGLAAPKVTLPGGAPFVVEDFNQNYTDHPGFTLVGALGIAELESMMRGLAKDSVNGKVNLSKACEVAGRDMTLCFVFRYRAVIAPEIPVVLNKQMAWIEPGTTVFHLLQRFSGRQLQGHFSSPLAGESNSIDRAGVNEALMRSRREQQWDRVTGDVVLLRRFEGGLVPVRTADQPRSALLDVVLQMGDEITWSR